MQTTHRTSLTVTDIAYADFMNTWNMFENEKKNSQAALAIQTCRPKTNARHCQVGMNRRRFQHTKGTVLDYRRHARQFEAPSMQHDHQARMGSVGNFHPEKRVENATPFQVAVVTSLELFPNSDQRLLECILTARVQHLLLDGGILRTPGQAES